MKITPFFMSGKLARQLNFHCLHDHQRASKSHRWFPEVLSKFCTLTRCRAQVFLLYHNKELACPDFSKHRKLSTNISINNKISLCSNCLSRFYPKRLCACCSICRGMLRMSMIISAMANSTTERVLLNGALNNNAFCVAVFKSTDTECAITVPMAFSNAL